MMDLTKIEKPFWLLGKETQDALKAHGGPYQLVGHDGWINVPGGVPLWIGSHTYRVKPQPVRGEAVFFSGTLETPFNSHRATFPTQDGKLIPGTYTGPDGAQIVVEAL